MDNRRNNREDQRLRETLERLNLVTQIKFMKTEKEHFRITSFHRQVHADECADYLHEMGVRNQFAGESVGKGQVLSQKIEQMYSFWHGLPATQMADCVEKSAEARDNQARDIVKSLETLCAKQENRLSKKPGWNTHQTMSAEVGEMTAEIEICDGEIRAMQENADKENQLDQLVQQLLNNEYRQLEDILAKKKEELQKKEEEQTVGQQSETATDPTVQNEVVVEETSSEEQSSVSFELSPIRCNVVQPIPELSVHSILDEINSRNVTASSANSNQQSNRYENDDVFAAPQAPKRSSYCEQDPTAKKLCFGDNVSREVPNKRAVDQSSTYVDNQQRDFGHSSSMSIQPRSEQSSRRNTVTATVTSDAAAVVPPTSAALPVQIGSRDNSHENSHQRDIRGRNDSPIDNRMSKSAESSTKSSTSGSVLKVQKPSQAQNPAPEENSSFFEAPYSPTRSSRSVSVASRASSGNRDDTFNDFDMDHFGDSSSMAIQPRYEQSSRRNAASATETNNATEAVPKVQKSSEAQNASKKHVVPEQDDFVFSPPLLPTRSSRSVSVASRASSGNHDDNLSNFDGFYDNSFSGFNMDLSSNPNRTNRREPSSEMEGFDNFFGNELGDDAQDRQSNFNDQTMDDFDGFE